MPKILGGLIYCRYWKNTFCSSHFEDGNQFQLLIETDSFILDSSFSLEHNFPKYFLVNFLGGWFLSFPLEQTVFLNLLSGWLLRWSIPLFDCWRTQFSTNLSLIVVDFICSLEKAVFLLRWWILLSFHHSDGNFFHWRKQFFLAAASASAFLLASTTLMASLAISSIPRPVTAEHSK